MGTLRGHGMKGAQRGGRGQGQGHIRRSPGTKPQNLDLTLKATGRSKHNPTGILEGLAEERQARAVGLGRDAPRDAAGQIQARRHTAAGRHAGECNGDLVLEKDAEGFSLGQ